MYKSQIEAYIEAHKEEMLEDIGKLVSIPSEKAEPLPGMPYGEQAEKCLRTALEMAEGYGFKVKNYDNYVGAVDFGDGPASLDILAHLDVVPAGNGWTVTEPYVMKRVENRIYGRGTADDKGPAIAALWAMKAIKELNIPISKRVRLLLGTDEESGSNDIEYYYNIEKEAPMTFSPDGFYPIINVEKGRLTTSFKASYEESEKLPRILSLNGGTKFNVVPDVAKVVMEGIRVEEIEAQVLEIETITGVNFNAIEEDGKITIVSRGVSGHGSMPSKGNNALTAMLELLSKLPMADSQGFTRLKGLNQVFPHGDWLGKAAGMAMSDKVSGDLTSSLNILNYSQTSLRGGIDCRTIVSSNKENSENAMETALLNAGIEIDKFDICAPHNVSSDSEFVQTLLNIYEIYSGEEGKCISVGGATYVHNLERGVAFGCAKLDLDNHMHGPDEFADINALMLSAKMFAEAIVRLCK